MVMMLFVLIAGILSGGLDASSVYGANVALPIMITGNIRGDSIIMDISGGINATGIQGTVESGTFTAGSKNSEVQMEIAGPPARTDFFSYMPQFDQRLYTIKLDTSSPQFKLNQMCRTDTQGFRRKGDAYLVAMGTYYGGRDNIGDQYKLTFSGGTVQEIIAVLGDCKSDAETDAKHQYHAKGDKTVVEFIMGTRDSKNNAVINEKFGTLVGISKIGITIKVEGSISGNSIKISGTANGTPFSASGELNSGNFEATGYYGSGSGGDLLWPTTSTYITSEFGYRTDASSVGGSTNHAGIDIGVAEGAPVVAAASGTVVIAETYGGYGKYIEIDHGKGLTTCYGHNSVIKVRKAQKVRAGDVIALSGNTGISTGPHLHFEVRLNGTPVDPMKYLRAKN
ncbi:M23 family metallopeptidase [Emergencia sp. 1XD21-10]|uniref:M23 family metallopeptidase n=1 Tax=Emergencia sp. 1XD21-10 TaxID=2304569 RepID=UPI00137ACC5E|nr:M23 family metallopeptidase [Emergencia sp. 1XD21-10]